MRPNGNKLRNPLSAIRKTYTTASRLNHERAHADCSPMNQMYPIRTKRRLVRVRRASLHSITANHSALALSSLGKAKGGGSLVSGGERPHNEPPGGESEHQKKRSKRSRLRCHMGSAWPLFFGMSGGTRQNVSNLEDEHGFSFRLQPKRIEHFGIRTAYERSKPKILKADFANYPYQTQLCRLSNSTSQLASYLAPEIIW